MGRPATGHHSCMGTPPAERAPNRVTVTTSLELRLVLSGDLAAPVPCRLAYAATAPFEVAAEFATADGPVTWVFARDLVRDGLTRAVGEGDVVVWPSRGPEGDVVCLALSSPSGRALLEADGAAVAAFVARTDALVPPGSESSLLDLDDVVGRLLSQDDPA
jgi:hypothetical protein